LKSVLHKPCPTELLEELHRHKRQQQLWKKLGQQQGPVFRQSFERRRAEKQGREEQCPDWNREDREQIPADTDSPPQRATQQITNPRSAIRGGSHEERRQRQAEDRPYGAEWAGGAAKGSTGSQLTQKIANASTKYDSTGCRPTNDITREPNRRASDGSMYRISRRHEASLGSRRAMINAANVTSKPASACCSESGPPAAQTCEFRQRDPRAAVDAPQFADVEVKGQPRMSSFCVAVVAAMGAVLTAWRTAARRA